MGYPFSAYYACSNFHPPVIVGTTFKTLHIFFRPVPMTSGLQFCLKVELFGASGIIVFHVLFYGPHQRREVHQGEALTVRFDRRLFPIKGSQQLFQGFLWILWLQNLVSGSYAYLTYIHSRPSWERNMIPLKPSMGKSNRSVWTSVRARSRLKHQKEYLWTLA